MTLNELIVNLETIRKNDLASGDYPVVLAIYTENFVMGRWSEHNPTHIMEDKNILCESQKRIIIKSDDIV